MTNEVSQSLEDAVRQPQAEFIKAPPKAVMTAIAKANAEHALASDAAVNALEAKAAAMRHAVACGKALLKAKERVGHGGFLALFREPKASFEGGKNDAFAFDKRQAQRYIKVATFPALARQALLEDQSERFNLDRTYAALSGATDEKEEEARIANASPHEVRKRIMAAKLAEVAEREIDEPTGLYDAIVIDPPWPMVKIEREVRPNQVGFDYPTMSEDELAALDIPADEHCHVWVWTTHKFMPMAFRLLDAWGLKYVCAFVWHKPGGFQPIGLPQYNCEFAMYARRGAPVFADTKAFPACFNAPRGAHSEKPEEFYDMVRRVTGGRRLDMFNRRRIDGFAGWGKEAAT